MVEEAGGTFLIPEALFLSKLDAIESFVFDWDGVFTDARTFSGGQSFFSETDSMGVNLLRFGYYLKKGTLPTVSIITGEGNEAVDKIASREHFDFVYTKAINKLAAAKHASSHHQLTLSNAAFVFDDVLDLSVAKVCGIRVFVSHRCAPLFNEYVRKHQLADYTTGSKGGEGAVREVCELFLGLWVIFDEVVRHRTAFSQEYQTYLNVRKTISPRYYSCKDDQIREL